MAQKSGDFQKLWQELKRRKVFKSTAMYAGTAFIILQLIDIVAQPLQLPAWTMSLVIVLLCTGFIITLLIAWMYDITPEGIRKTESIEAVRKKKSQAEPVRRRIKAGDIIIAVMALVIVILLYPKIFKRDTLEKLRSSGDRIIVAVLPFQNMTNDTIWNVWQDGIQDILISFLSNSDELRVRQIESITDLLRSKGLTNYASITPSVASTISKKLNANIFIQGSIKKAGVTIRINTQIIDSNTEETISSFQIDGTAENILQIADSLSKMIGNLLVVSKLKKELFFDLQNIKSVNSPEAYRYFTYGQKAFLKRDFSTARNWILQAIAIDSNFYSAINMLPVTYAAQGLYEQADKWSLWVYKKRDQMPVQNKIFANWLYAKSFETPYESTKYLNQLLEFDDQVPLLHFQLGLDYMDIYQYDNAITAFEKALDIYKKWDSKPMWAYNYSRLGSAYHKTRQYKKEKELYVKAEQDFPDDFAILYNQAVLSLTSGDTTMADFYMKKYISIRKEQSWSEGRIANILADIYSEADMWDKAEIYYRQALASEPENPVRLNNLAYCLSKNNANINEALSFIDKALQLDPGHFMFLATKGELLYKMGRYEEALELLEKSWKLKPAYNHWIYLDIQATKKAITNQKRADR
jgi:tetratricopeptide (TPR) repeat protein